jgi:hypothetical protein
MATRRGEYKVISGNNTQLEAQLNQFGLSGWKAVLISGTNRLRCRHHHRHPRARVGRLKQQWPQAVKPEAIVNYRLGAR